MPNRAYLSLRYENLSAYNSSIFGEHKIYQIERIEMNSKH